MEDGKGQVSWRDEVDEVLRKEKQKKIGGRINTNGMQTIQRRKTVLTLQI